MNAIVVNDIVHEINGGSDTDTNPDDTPEYYQPISADVSDSDSDSDPDQVNSNVSYRHGLPNGYCDHEAAENGVASMHLNDDSVVEEKSSSEDEEEEEEEEADDSAIMRAFREDENRRNAPLPPENAMRVMEAMRSVSIGGLTPDWVNQVPDDRWIDQLRRIRQPPRTTTTSTNVQH